VSNDTRAGGRSSRAGAHRASRVSTPTRVLDAAKSGKGSRGKSGAFGVGFRSRSMLIRTAAVVVLAALIGVGLARPGVPSPEPTVSDFLLAWESQHYLQAAKLTTGPPKTVAAALERAY
jgi:hypothetical protein